MFTTLPPASLSLTLHPGTPAAGPSPPRGVALQRVCLSPCPEVYSGGLPRGSPPGAFSPLRTFGFRLTAVSAMSAVKMPFAFLFSLSWLLWGLVQEDRTETATFSGADARLESQ